MFNIVKTRKDISPQIIEPNKLRATGDEAWASAFIYPNR